LFSGCYLILFCFVGIDKCGKNTKKTKNAGNKAVGQITQTQPNPYAHYLV